MVDAFLIFLNFYLMPGLVLGSIYALGAIGVSLIFGILRFAHFAHGDLMTLGAYLALTLVAGLGLSPLVALPFAMAGTIVISFGIDRFFYKPFRDKSTIVLVIASFGVALMLRSLIKVIWGVEIETYSVGISRPLVFFDSIRIAERHIWIIVLTLVLMVAVHGILTRTRIGKAMRAVSDSPELARLAGISTERVVKATWVIGGALAAAAGVFIGWDTQLQSSVGWNLLLPIFAATILGGIGRPYGAMAGGLIIGLAEELSSYPWIGSEPLLSPGYKTGIAFAIMVAMLIWRPSGLFRGRVY
ncbi:MAG: branched-chain amino acid ABC transporter permease [Alphaproteobacteria bacterium]|jgi:branched-subunit amino acid ABC-type transport system permease component|nr:amino acid ABC transporter permease [Rhodospirillaceae bacterium]MDP6405119.1 branched-chain amino acid ABC transporter permease [Alphaproteobacteria bacterium]MDP6624623.1 branched-chain amino acid ABC transporter permease [Alphaproteobacteria bacterium]|tara:strand:+ start:313 stop:1215 length:903 start_codon:yes stop_codon:yes gene_type:complete